jgi:hypothetical protein
MYHETKQAERNEGRSAKVYAVAAAILAGWLMMFGGVMASVHGRPALHSSIETVLSASSPAQPAIEVTFAQR